MDWSCIVLCAGQYLLYFRYNDQQSVSLEAAEFYELDWPLSGKILHIIYGSYCISKYG